MAYSAGSSTQTLTTKVRLPESVQADSLRLLAVAQQIVNDILVRLWPALAEFGQEAGPAWKQVAAAVDKPEGLPDRVWRCCAESAGRILRSQAARARAFERLLPILSDSLIVPAQDNRKARKHRSALNKQVAALGTDVNGLLLLNIAEQACNFYLEHDYFPETYDALQPIPVLSVGLLTLAGDDGPIKGQAYRLAWQAEQLVLSLKMPGVKDGQWTWQRDIRLELPEAARELLARGVLLAPQLRVVEKADGEQRVVLDLPVAVALPEVVDLDSCERILAFDWGVRKLLSLVVLDTSGQQLSRPMFLDVGGLDGKQSRLRSEIDHLKTLRDACAQDSPEWAAWQERIDACWLAFGRRNQALAHLASNLLIAVGLAYGCQLIAGENLASLKTHGQGYGKAGRTRNWRNTTTLRSAITDKLRYKTALLGIRLRFEQPRQTSHTCPHCGQPAHTYKASDSRLAVDYGAWLRCEQCGWNGSRDYAGALNVGRLAIAYLCQRRAFSMKSLGVQHPVSYSVTGAATPSLPQALRWSRFSLALTRSSVSGWLNSMSFQPALQLCSNSCLSADSVP